MIRMTAREVCAATGAVHVAGPQAALHGVSTDTRSLEPGALFVALQGPSFDGNRFAAEALARGAGAVLLRGEPAEAQVLARSLAGEVTLLVHPDPRAALADLARWHRARLDIPVLGITGSCGKTTTKNILLQLLAQRMAVTGSPNSFNNDIGVPHTLFLADERSAALVVELGTNRPGEIAALCRTARPTAGILTNIGASHLEGLGSIEGVAREKSDLVASLPRDGFAVLSADCAWTTKVRPLSPARVLTVSIDGQADLEARELFFQDGGTTFRLRGLGLPATEVFLPLLGRHNVSNLLCALAACAGLGLDLSELLPAVGRLVGGRRRMERIELGDVLVLDDSYNANPESTAANVRVLAGLHGHRRRVLVLGDMLELGEGAAEHHRELGRLAAGAGVDRMLLVGELSQATRAGALEAGFAPEHALHADEVGAAQELALGLIEPGDVVLVKGSRRIGLERVVARLVERFGAPARPGSLV